MKRVKTLIVGLMIGLILLSANKVYPDLVSRSNSVKETEHIQELIEDPQEEKSFTHKSWEALFQENEDFKGYLKFDSGLIGTPVVQGQDNEEYLRKSFEGKYDTQGIPFMDAMCSTYSANITIYGHKVYYDSKVKFSPLEKLTDERMADGNRTVSFYLEDGYREYEVVAVLYITSEEAEVMNYAQPSFITTNQKSEWLQFMMNKNLIRVKTEPSPYDNFLTLQTCRKWNDNEHLLVICAETGRFSY
ncbi:MAG: class B sortase [Solobacterium sp.]|nr:class B sortase [Solobacterium sp.]